jgi:hypothetical protein
MNIIRVAQSHPMDRCDIVPFGADSCAASRTIAANAKMAWAWITGDALRLSKGASVKAADHGWRIG